MKPKSKSMHVNPLTPALPGLPVRMPGHRKMLLGVAAMAAMLLSGCVVTEVGYEGGGYYPYYGPYYGSYGPYSGGLGYGGLYRGGHHFAGNSFGRAGFAPGGFSRGGNVSRGGGVPHAGARGAGGHGGRH